jgi:hypothetical protein
MTSLSFLVYLFPVDSLTLCVSHVRLKVIKPAKAIRASAPSNWRVTHFLGVVDFWGCAVAKPLDQFAEIIAES